MVYQVLHQQLTLVQTRRDDVCRHHGVGDVERNDGLDAVAFLLGNARAHLGTSQQHYQQRKGSHEQGKLHPRTRYRRIGHKLAKQLGITKLLQLVLTLLPYHKPYQKQYGNGQQQPQIYRVFKSKHYGILLNTVVLNRISSNKQIMAATANGW